MKTFLLSAVLLLLSISAQAQVGIGTVTPNASSVLDIESTDKGILIPRMTQSQRDLIGSPVDGLLLYQTDNSPGFYYWDDTLSSWNGVVSTDDQNISFSGGTLTIEDGNSVSIPDNDTTYSGSDFALSNQTCPAGQKIAGITSGGTVVCMPDLDSQQIDQLLLAGTVLNISLQNDGIPTQTLDLSSLQDGTGTDNQTIDQLSLSGTTLQLSIEDDGVAPQTVNLTSLQDGTGTDDQTIDQLSLSGTTLQLSLEGDGVAPQTVNLSSLQDGTGTDNQAIDQFSISGSTLSLSLEDDGAFPQTVNLSALQNTLEEAYNQGGPGAGRTITTNNGPVEFIKGTSGNEALRVITNSGTGANQIGGYFEANGFFQTVTPIAIDAVASSQNDFAMGVRTVVNSGASQTPGGFLNNYGLKSEVIVPNIGSSLVTNYGIHAIASQGNANWAGYFGNGTVSSGTGNVYVNDQLHAFGSIYYRPSQVIPPSGYVLQTGAGGLITPVDPATISSGTDNQTIDTFSFNSSTNELSLELEDDGIIPQTVDLSTLLQTDEIDWYRAGFTVKPTAITDNIYTLGNVAIGKNAPNYALDIIETDNSQGYTANIEKEDNTTTLGHSALRVSKTTDGNSVAYGINNLLYGSGSGKKIALSNSFINTSSGSKIGVSNSWIGTGSGIITGLENNFDFVGTSANYGVRNNFDQVSGIKIGMNNTFASPSGTNQEIGILNQFNTAGSTGIKVGSATNFGTVVEGSQTGYSSSFGSTNSTDKIGFKNNFSLTTQGTMYGAQINMNATSNSTKYGVYVDFDSAVTGSDNYGIHSTVENSDGWAGYFLGKNYISEKLGIGKNDPDGFLHIEGNSGVSTAHIELTETSALDGGRIKFNNTVETDNNWTIYGRARDVVSSSRFNLFHSTTGNIMVATGDGNVGFQGTPDTDLHLYHGNNGTSSGMKLQNSNNNVWWRMYVSSGSSDLRLYNSTNGTAIMGAFDDVTGAYTNTSDRRLKTNFKDLHFNWDQFMQLEPLNYTYKADKDKEQQVGMVAQDVEPIYPELVNYNEDDDIYHLNYSGFGVIAIKAVQEMKKEMEALSEENRKLKQQLAKYESLEARLTALENSNKLNPVKISEKIVKKSIHTRKE